MLTVEQAAAVWKVLRLHAGASDSGRTSFISHVTDRDAGEYRFQGKLGFGGKFYCSGRWYVSNYKEDRTPETEQIISKVNRLLAVIQQGGIVR